MAEQDGGGTPRGNIEPTWNGQQFAHLGDWSTLAARSYWAEVAARLHDMTAVNVLHELLNPWEKQLICSRTHVAGSVSQHLGVLETARHDYGPAKGHFERALAVHSAFAAPFHLARTHLEWGRCLLDEGRPGGFELARPHLVSARDIAARGGCNQVAARAEQLL